MSLLDSLQIFFGDASQAEARVYACLPSSGLPPGCELSGCVVGPTCEYAHTLPARVPFAARQGGQWLLAEAIVPDPCFWSDELPFLYQVKVELLQDGVVLDHAQSCLGIRPVGPRGKRLVQAGKNWVVRGVHRDAVDEVSLERWRDTSTAMIVAGPDDQLCEQASRLGAWLIAVLRGEETELIAELRRLGKWPAVVMAILDTDFAMGAELRQEARNLLLAQRYGLQKNLAPWAQAVLMNANAAAALGTIMPGCSLPVIVERRLKQRRELAEARRECDRLQRDLAGTGEFAGYLV